MTTNLNYDVFIPYGDRTITFYCQNYLFTGTVEGAEDEHWLNMKNEDGQVVRLNIAQIVAWRLHEDAP